MAPSNGHLRRTGWEGQCESQRNDSTKDSANQSEITQQLQHDVKERKKWCPRQHDVPRTGEESFFHLRKERVDLHTGEVIVKERKKERKKESTPIGQKALIVNIRS